MALDSSTHFALLRQWLEREAEAEKKEFEARREELKSRGKAAEETGQSLLALTIEDEYAGLGGRAVLVLRKNNRTPLPWTRLDVGSPIFLSADGSEVKGSERGVVWVRRADQIHVVFDEVPELIDEVHLLRLDLAYDDITRRRERAALDRAEKAKGDRLAGLRDVMLGLKAPAFDLPSDDLDFFDQGLNADQRLAVKRALAARDLAIVHGPPGTGKTTVLLEIVRQSVHAGKKVLVTAPSHLGVDNLLEKILAAGLPAVRIGHPARVMEELQAATLDAQVEKHPDTKLARGLMREASQLFRQARRYTRAAPPRGSKQATVQEARAMMADARKLEARAIDRVLDQASIIASTATGVDGSTLGSRRFDLVVFDEAGQATEPTTWIPLLRSDRVVLGGDHCQLPPTVLAGEEGGLSVSLLERLALLYGSQITQLLTVQYRMNELIMGFSSQFFYEGKLKADPSVKDRRLAPLLLPGSEVPVIQWIDTAGAGFEESAEGLRGSRKNEKEAQFIQTYVAHLLNLGLKPEQLAVISPYAAQVRDLRQLIDDARIEVDTIDGFQGREKEVVLISLVRSNDQQEIGFLRETRRLNVALTRAKRHLLIVGDSATIGGHPFYSALLSYFETAGAYLSIWETSWLSS